MVKIFADGADLVQMVEAAKNPAVRGFTTNPSLMRKAGIKDYRTFAKLVIDRFPTYPISFEVIADEFDEMERQASQISSWGENVYVKIPVTNTKGQSACPLIARLATDGVKVNVTAILCHAQIDAVLDALGLAPAIVSVFAGRIADTGRNPEGFITHALKKKRLTCHEILWASPRQVLDVYTAEALGCDIITCTPEIIGKLSLEGKKLEAYSLETVQMFRNDALAAGYSL